MHFFFILPKFIIISMKTGLVLEGGAMRGMFTGGCLDVLMENGITFDGFIGVSAGACFGCNFKSRQIKRAINYNKKYAKNPRYCSFWSWLFTGDLYNAKFCYDLIPNKLEPFDVKAFQANPIEFYLVVTDVDTGKPVYYKCTEGTDHDTQYIRASASMPLASRVVRLDGRGYLDGGISDPIPLKAFQDMGYEKNVVILTQPEGYVKEPNSLQGVMKVLLKKYPALIEDMRIRHDMYNGQTAYVREQEKLGNVFVIRPEAPLQIGKSEHDPDRMQAVYDQGRREMEKNLEKMKAFLKG